MDMQFNGFWQGLYQFVSSSNEMENCFLTRLKEGFGHEMTIDNLVTEIYQVVIREQYFEPKQTQQMQILIRQLKHLSLPLQLQERIGVISTRLEIFSREKWDQHTLQNRDVKNLLKKINDFFHSNPEAKEIQIGHYFIPKSLIEKIQANQIHSSTGQLLSTQIIRDHEQNDVLDLNGFEKELLLQYSPVFHTLWLGGFKEAQTHYEVPVTNAKGLKILIESLYRPEILKNHREDIFYLLHTAHHYEMHLCEENLKLDWADLLKECLDAEELDSTMTELLQFAKDYDLEFGLQSKMQKMLNDSLNEAIDQPETFARRVDLIKNDLIECDLHATRCSDENLKALGQLTSLKKLNLSECHKVTNKGISYLQDLPLEFLNLSECKKIKEDALRYLLKMPLEELILHHFDKCHSMEITQKGINWLQKISKLKSLTLQTITQKLEKNLEILQLQRLNISFIGGEINFQLLRRLPLKKLQLLRCEIADAEFLNFQDISLELLDLRCNVTDKGLQSLKKMEKIGEVYLQLNDEENTDEGLKCLKNIPSLKRLDLTNYEITKETFQCLRGIALEELTFHVIDSRFNCIADDELKILLGMPLKTLVFIASKNFTDQSFEYLKCFPLEKLEISSEGDKITGSGFEHLQNLPLKELSFSDFTSFKMENLTYFEKLTSLKRLEFNCCTLNGEGFKFLQNLSLEKLILSTCSDINNRGLECIKTLKYLKFVDCEDLSDEQLENLPMSLTFLSLYGAKQITDKTLKYLQGRALKLLDLSFTQITDEGLKLLEGLPLESVNLYACQNITDNGMKYLKNLNIEICRIPYSNAVSQF